VRLRLSRCKRVFHDFCRHAWRIAGQGRDAHLRNPPGCASRTTDRPLRALLRHRVQLVWQRTGLRNRIHAVVADYGYDRPAGGYWTGPGRAWLASLELPAVSREVVEDDLAMIDALDSVIGRLDGEFRQRARSDPRAKDDSPLKSGAP